LIAFWLALHLEKLEYINFIYEMDPLIEKIISNMRRQGRGDLLEDKER